MFPIALLPLIMFLFGIALILSSGTVFFRDFNHVLEPLLTILFYATPIIYNLELPAIPENVKSIIALNPFTQFVELFRMSTLSYYPLDFNAFFI